MLDGLQRWLGLKSNDPSKPTTFEAMRADYYRTVEARLREGYALQGLNRAQVLLKQSIITEVCKQGREAALAESEEFLARTRSFEPDIEKILRASGQTGMLRDRLEKTVRSFIWSPRHDPETACDTLLGYANMTDQVMTNIRLSRHNRATVRKSNGLLKNEEFVEAHKDDPLLMRPYKQVLEETIQKYRQICWASGPFYVEERLKYILNTNMEKSQNWQDQMTARRLMDSFLNSKSANGSQKKKSRHRHERDTRPLLPSTSTGQLDTPEIVIELGKLLEWEQDESERLQSEVNALLDSMPAITARHEQGRQNLETAVALCAEAQKATKALLEQKQQVLKEIEAKNGRTEDYETSATIKSLVENEILPQSRLSLLHNPAAKKPLEFETKIAGKNLDVFIEDAVRIAAKKAKEPEIAPLIAALKEARAVNSVIHVMKSEKQMEHDQTRRLGDTCEGKTRKLSDRAAALERIMPELQAQIDEMRFDLLGLQNGEVANGKYPPLSELENWVNTNFKGRLRVHRDAFNMVSSPTFLHRHPEWIYQGLEVLGRDFWNQKMSGEQGNGVAQNLRHTFKANMDARRMRVGGSVTDLGSQRVRNEYYASFDGQRMFMDQHLRRGSSRDPAQQLCIYFTWNDRTNTVMVGHLPTHLETR